MSWRACLRATVLAAITASAATAQPLTVAAASDLQAVLPQITRQFQTETGSTITPIFGSSGNFFAQIQNGAPFDVFLSADIEYPKQLIAAGLADPQSLYEYAAGRLVLWARKGSGIDVSRGLAVLGDARIRRIAIANPEHAPYGRAAVTALQRDGLYDRVEPKLVLGENISQAAQFVQSGAADVGLIALSLTVGPEARAIGVSQEIAAPRIDQAAVILSSARNKVLARRFLDFLATPDSIKILSEYGFIRP